MTTSFHIGTFWFHVTWNADGSAGRDQHGTLWLDINNPHTRARVVEMVAQVQHDTIITLFCKMKAAK
jgi:hypothetical protein